MVDPTIFDPHFLILIKLSKYENSSCQYWEVFIGSVVGVSKIPFSHIRFANMKFTKYKIHNERSKSVGVLRV